MCHVRQQHLETLGDECAPCNRPARRKCTNGRTLLQTVGETQHNTKRASARAHKKQNRNCVTFVNNIQKILETSAHLAIGPQGASTRRDEHHSKLLGNTRNIQSERQQGPIMSKIEIVSRSSTTFRKSWRRVRTLQ